MELTIRREKKHMISSKMIHMYCHAHHNTDKQSLCDHCQAISDYSEFRTSKCPYIDHVITDFKTRGRKK